MENVRECPSADRTSSQMHAQQARIRRFVAICPMVGTNFKISPCGPPVGLRRNSPRLTRRRDCFRSEANVWIVRGG